MTSNLRPHDAARLIETACDLLVELDEAGRVLQVRFQDPSLKALGSAAWVGREWADSVTVESRGKLQASLRDAREGTPGRWRQVNHPVSGADDVPISYMTAAVAESEGAARYVAFGRDLRGIVALQKRLVEAQQTMERDYWRFREADTRYRHLMQTSPEPVLVVDGQNQRVIEANPAADALSGRARGRIVGAQLPALLDARAAEPLQALLAAARAVGKREAARMTLADGQTQVMVSATLFRQDQQPFLLVRMVPVEGAQEPPVLPTGLPQVFFAQSADALVFTDAQGRVLAANKAFALMAELSAEDQARGEMLDRWLGRTGVELSVLVTNLRQRGSVGLFTTALRGEFGSTLEVEISASVLNLPEGSRLAFAIRDVSRRLQGEERTPDRISRSVGELTELVGRVPMKDIVSETTDLIEQLCIEAALQMTQGNRASAAQLLGLSRQSLYVKLNRFGIGGSQAAGDTDDERPAVNIN